VVTADGAAAGALADGAAAGAAPGAAGPPTDGRGEVGALDAAGGVTAAGAPAAGGKADPGGEATGRPGRPARWFGGDGAAVGAFGAPAPGVLVGGAPPGWACLWSGRRTGRPAGDPCWDVAAEDGAGFDRCAAPAGAPCGGSAVGGVGRAALGGVGDDGGFTAAGRGGAGRAAAGGAPGAGGFAARGGAAGLGGFAAAGGGAAGWGGLAATGGRAGGLAAGPRGGFLRASGLALGSCAGACAGAWPVACTSIMGARSIVVPAAFWLAGFSLVHAAALAGSQAKPDKIVPARRRR